MKLLLKDGFVVNVFTGEIEEKNVLIEDERIIGVGNYDESDADMTEDVNGKYICPGFIDSHMHIESTMLLPAELARVCLPHGTTAIVADPHEIANVCGTAGIEYMLAASEDIPMMVYVMLPSCVPSTPFDETGAVLTAEELFPFYSHPRVLGLAEMMNYPGVVNCDPDVSKKIRDARRLGLPVNGHAPLLTGEELDRYIAAGIGDDHECTSAEEAMERIRKGQWIMIRQGTAARNLEALLPLFEPPFAHRCLLVTDDRHPADILNEGHIDSIIRAAVAAGKSAVTAIQMATIQAAQRFNMIDVGAVASGYYADLAILDDLETINVCQTYYHGQIAASNGESIIFPYPDIPKRLQRNVLGSFALGEVTKEQFVLEPRMTHTRVIRVIPGQLLTEEWVAEMNWDVHNGIDLERDILKIAVLERHRGTGHMGLGFISGIGMKSGAIASSVAHDSHNLIVIGTNEKDMAEAANRIREIGGGCVVVENGEILAEMALPVGGLMTMHSASVAAELNKYVRTAVHRLGVPADIEPFMNMAFVSLPVIPSLKMTTKGLVNVDAQEIVSIFTGEPYQKG